MNLLAKKLGFADQMFKNIKVENGQLLAEDVVSEYNRGGWSTGYSGQSPERLKAHLRNQAKFDPLTLRAPKDDPEVGGDYYGPPADRFNAGQKSIYWVVVLGGLLVAASGYLLMFPFYGTGIAAMQLSHIVHGAVGLLYIAALVFTSIWPPSARKARSKACGTVSWTRTGRSRTIPSGTSGKSARSTSPRCRPRASFGRTPNPQRTIGCSLLADDRPRRQGASVGPTRISAGLLRRPGVAVHTCAGPGAYRT